ncbi:MAG TPA: YncE family protein [Blastocatellia bacterium]|nr:YncE family protein [Blastocatellia bacterium]
MLNPKIKRSHLGLLMLLIAVAPITIKARQSGDTKSNSTGYHLLRKIEIGGEGGWDYVTVDSDMRRVYVSHATRVVVLDADKGTVVGEIPNTNGVHGIAIVPELGRGFTSNGRDATATIFDLKTLKVIGQAKTGKNPDAIIYDPVSRRVFAFNGTSHDATVIDAASGEVAGTIELGGKPEFAAADGKGMVYVNIEDKSEVVAIDSRNLKVKAHWPLAPGEEPSGMAMDRKHRRLFIVCANKKMIVMDPDGGRVVTSLPIGGGVDAAAFDPETKLVFSSNGEGTLTVVRQESADKYSVVENAPTQRGARTMALDPKTHNLYLPTAQFGPPPAPTPERPRPRPSIVPGSFTLLVFGK